MEPEGSLPHSQASATCPYLGQPNPVHISTSHLLEIHPNITHPSTPRSPQWSLSLRFPHQDPIRPPLLTHTRHMPSPSHSSQFYRPHNIGLVCLSGKWRMLQTNYSSGGLCQRDYDRLDEQVRTPLIWLGSVRIVGRLWGELFPVYFSAGPLNP